MAYSCSTADNACEDIREWYAVNPGTTCPMPPLVGADCETVEKPYLNGPYYDWYYAGNHVTSGNNGPPPKPPKKRV